MVDDPRAPEAALTSRGACRTRWPVFSKIKDRNIWTIYEAILTLGVAYGISIALIPHHLDLAGFTKSQMGSLASWFALGIVALSLPMGGLIERFSAKTTLVVALAGYAASVTLLPLLDAYPIVALDRFADGACSVGIWVSCETILLTRAPVGMKAYVTTLYAMAVAIGYIVGPLAAEGIIRVISIHQGFFVSGGLAALSTLLVVLRLDRRRRDEPARGAARQRTRPTRRSASGRCSSRSRRRASGRSPTATSRRRSCCSSRSSSSSRRGSRGTAPS